MDNASHFDINDHDTPVVAPEFMKTLHDLRSLDSVLTPPDEV